jgi:hypothetical protein
MWALETVKRNQTRQKGVLGFGVPPDAKTDVTDTALLNVTQND